LGDRIGNCTDHLLLIFVKKEKNSLSLTYSAEKTPSLFVTSYEKTDNLTGLAVERAYRFPNVLVAHGTVANCSIYPADSDGINDSFANI